MWKSIDELPRDRRPLAHENEDVVGSQPFEKFGAGKVIGIGVDLDASFEALPRSAFERETSVIVEDRCS